MITFPIYADANHCSKLYDVILVLDATVELVITIDDKNKSIIWEYMSIPIKHISGASPLSNEIAIGKPIFATMQPSLK